MVTVSTPLGNAQLVRYARQILLEEVGESGQARLLAAKVLVVGAGGLGVPVASYLGAAGIGMLGLADSDLVDRTNLPRQVIYSELDIGYSKVQRLEARILDNNPEVQIMTHPRLTPENASAVIEAYDWIVDGSDNFQTRYLLNAICARQKKTLISGALSRFTGQLAVFRPGDACYQCLVARLPNRDATQGCVEGGILGPMAGLLGCWQALETLKQILALSSRLQEELLLFDALNNSSHRIRMRKDQACPVCGE
ncbi:HesA/MoeB/ThiF family protein [Thermithiobacillus plumbiphilus]|uniref:HesA/MoeB/ThiF family protein n=1 Tax=Thermithiobacillus plumbiphilus TaxID=1729899 RepID=A0ABU9D787_9PROT